VKVSLHDCLACSGCITSAETVLIEQQSTGLLLLHQTPFSVLGFLWFLISNHHPLGSYIFLIHKSAKEMP
jgi:iron only hydrogenase large subunit-like protein